MKRTGLKAAPRLLGAVLLLTALLKALDSGGFAVQLAFYGLLPDRRWVEAAAWLLPAIEGAFGILLLIGAGPRRVLAGAALGLLAGFSLLVLWAWVYRGLEDCGCFGRYLPMGPASTLLKNLALMALAGAGLRSGGGELRVRRWLIALAAGAALALLGLATRQHEEPKTAKAEAGSAFAAHSVDGRSLAEGQWLVVLLSDSCEDCAAALPALNALARQPALPPLAGLVLGEGESLKRFRRDNAPAFPLIPIGPLEFFEWVPEAPPRLLALRDGRLLAAWDGPPPDSQALVAAFAAAPEKSD